jgi:flagellar hook assembly protein FlgD
MNVRSVVAATVLTCALLSRAQADTPVSGVISTNTTWTVAGSPYIVTADIAVFGGSSPVLTIQAGVTVKFNAGTKLLIGYYGVGGLQAIGTSGSPITFTANNSTTPGFYQGIHFANQALASSRIEQAFVRYGGGSGFGAGIKIENASPTLATVTVENNTTSGVTTINSSATIQGCTFRNNPWGLSVSGTGTVSLTGTTVTTNTSGGIWVASPASLSMTTVSLTNNTGYAISENAAVTLGTVSGLTATGNTNNAIELRGSYTQVNTTWKNVGIPYVATGELQVFGGSSPVLTIEAGVTVKFNSGTRLLIGYYGIGGLQAIGTSVSPITFTANNSTTPGFWQGIHFANQALSTSRIERAFVSYGGGSGLGAGIKVENASATLVWATVENNAGSGVTTVNSSSTIQNCTLRSNPWGLSVSGTGTASLTGTTVTTNTSGGIWVASPASLSMTTVSLTNNTGYAISQNAAVTFGTVSGLTATGNTNNAIELRGSFTQVNTTWKSAGIPYVVTGEVQVHHPSTTPILTIQAGATLRFASGQKLLVGYFGNARLQAVGTVAAPIVFTAHNSTSPGFWQGIDFRAGASASSRVERATVSYAGSGIGGGILVENSSPTIAWVTASNNSGSGIRINNGSPTVIHSSFTGNPAGIINATPTVSVMARLNYWGHSSGPSGSGPGTGQSVSTGVTYEPWLMTVPASAHYFTTFTQANRTFNPAIAVNTTVTGGTATSGTWTTKIINSGGATVRTFTGTGASGTSIWNGKNDASVDQPDGSYFYQLESVSGANVAANARGVRILDRTKQLTVTGYAALPAFFSPNGDGAQDTTAIGGTNSFDDTVLTLTIKNSGGATVRTANPTGMIFSYSWNGKNGSGVTQPDGVYTYDILATNGTASATSSTTGTLDRTLPGATVSAPTSGQVLSNVYTNGVTDVAITGSASDINLLDWTVGWGVGSTPSSYTDLATGTAGVTNGTFATWPTWLQVNGQYAVRLTVRDKAGNQRQVVVPNTIGHFRTTHFGNQRQVNGGANETITYQSIIPFPLTETLVIKNEAGQVVRTLVNGVARAAGTYSDVWNVRNGSGVLVADGPYFHVGTVTNGTNTLIHDQTPIYWNDGFHYNDGLPLWNVTWDPFNNQPLNVNWNLSGPGRVTIAISTASQGLGNHCNPPQYCLIQEVYWQTGPDSFQWAGLDANNDYRGDVKGLAAIIRTKFFSKNAVVVFGSKPKVTNVRVTPAIYGPATGTTQSIQYNLATYLNEQATVTITLMNLKSKSILRTLNTGLQSPGLRTATWNGRADNGEWVAPGAYAVTVTATDPRGYPAKGQILTTLQY